MSVKDFQPHKDWYQTFTMSELVTLKSDHNSIFNIQVQDVYGGKEIKLNPGWDLQTTVDFVRDFKIKEEADVKVRENNAFVKGLYDQYKTALELARKENANL